MGSRKAELYQNSVGKKRKKLDARAFKALFKRQRIMEGLPDIHGKLEGPDKVSQVCNGNGRVTGSKPIGEEEDVSDDCCKRLKGNLRHLSIDKVSGGDLQKSTGNLTRTVSEILGNNITVDSDYTTESPNPLSLADTRTDSSTPKGIDYSERLPTGCSISESTSTSKSGMDPAIGELTDLQGTRVAASKEGHSTITASIPVESLQKDSISTDDAPNSMSGRCLLPDSCSLGAEVGTGGTEESLLSEQNNCQKFLCGELGRLCQILKLSFSEKASDSGKDCLLADEDSSKEPSHIIDDAPLFALSKEKRAKVEIEEIIEIILKQKLGMNVKAAGSDIHDKIKKNQKKCEKRMKKLVRKQEEEVQGLLRTWDEEKVKLEKDHKLESAVTRCIHGHGLVRTSKLKILDDKFAKKMEEHNLLKDMQLNSLKEKQLATRNEECQKAANWLAEAVAYARKLGTVNGRHAFGFQSENGRECTESGSHIMHTGPENLVTMLQEHAEDLNPSINLFPQGNDVAPSDASIGAPAETADCGCLVETMSNMETFSFPNKVGVMSLERPPEIQVGQHKQLLQSCNTTEEILAANLPVCGEQTTDEIRPVQMNEGGPTELTKPVSDDISLHGDPMESNNTSNIGDSIGLPNTEVNHRSEPCQSSNGSLPFPGQLLVHSQEMVAFPDHCGLLKQHVSQNEIHHVTSGELVDDRYTPAADIQNTSQIEVAASELRDVMTLVQSNHAVPVTRNCEQLNHLSADASLACNQYPPHEIEHQNRNQGTNFSLLVAEETEDFSHDFVSQSSENLHHSRLDLGQASNTIMCEVVSTTELPNQTAPQLGTTAGYFHGSRNNESEITRFTCVQVSQNEIQLMPSSELVKLDTPAVEPKNTSQTDVASEALNLVQSNYAVPVTGNYEQLHHLSVDASIICNEYPPDEIEHQNRDQVTKFPQAVETGQTEVFSHEFASQSNENLHHNHLCMGQVSSSSLEQSVEMFVRSPDNTVMAQAASTTELPNQSVPRLGMDAGHLRGPSHLFVHPTHPVASWNSTSSSVAEPLQNELEKLLKEAEHLEKKRADAVSELKSACEKEIQEIINLIRIEYDKKLQDAEANFKLKRNELEKGKKLVLMNTKLAEAFRSKFQFRPLQLQQVFASSLEQHLHRPSLPPPMRISSLASASRPPPSQQTLAPSTEVLNQLHIPPVRSSPVAVRNVTASLPIQATQRAGSVLPCTSARPLVIASHTPAANPHIPEIRSRAPHLQSFRPAAAPSIPPSSFSAIPQRHPRPIFPPQLVGTPRPAPPPPPRPHLIPNHVSQNAPNPLNEQPFHLNLSQSPTDLPRDVNRHVLINHNLPPLADDSTITLGNIQCNSASSAVDTDIVCLSDDE